MNDLDTAYIGSVASNYDRKRMKSRRWAKENAVMNEIFRRRKPQSVLDCHFGTGRWLDLFNLYCSKVIGMDISEDMLRCAQEKILNQGGNNSVDYDLRSGSIFDISKQALSVCPDIIVCIRFVNWVNFSDLTRAITSLTDIGSDHLVLGASVIPENAGYMQKILRKFALRLINKRSADSRQQYVHNEKDLVKLFCLLGWRIHQKHIVMKRTSRINYIYELIRTQ